MSGKDPKHSRRSPEVNNNVLVIGHRRLEVRRIANAVNKQTVGVHNILHLYLNKKELSTKSVL